MWAKKNSEQYRVVVAKVKSYKREFHSSPRSRVSFRSTVENWDALTVRELVSLFETTTREAQCKQIQKHSNE